MRFLLRLLGCVTIAAGFVALVVDGARSIANSTLAFTAVGEVLSTVLRERYALIQSAIERQIHPLLWDPVVMNLMLAPAALAALLLGFMLLWLGRPPAPQVGVVTRR